MKVVKEIALSMVRASNQWLYGAFCSLAFVSIVFLLPLWWLQTYGSDLLRLIGG